MFRRLVTAAAVAALALATLAAPAGAHVTVNSTDARPGGFAVLAFRVPNERSDAATTELSVQFPPDHPIANVSVQPKAGWSYEVVRSTVAEPVDGEGDATEVVSQITWRGGRIAPGEFDEFRVSVGPLPEDVDALTFKALQTYEDGEVVRWIDERTPGGPEPERPAPVLALSGEATDGAGAAESADGDASAAEPGGAGEAAAADDDDGTDTLSIVALVVAGLALVAALAALGLRPTGGRRSSGASGSSSSGTA